MLSFERFDGWFAKCEWPIGVNVVVNQSVLVLILIRSVLFYNPIITRKKYLNEHCRNLIFFFYMRVVKLKLSVATP